MTGTLSEIYSALIAAMEADTGAGGLSSLLAPGIASGQLSILQDWPDNPPQFPALILKLSSSRPITELSTLGLWRPRLQIDILGVDPIIQRDIESRLNTLLDIPRTNTSGLVTTNFTVDLAYWLDTQESGEIRWQNTDQVVKSLATLWMLRVKHN